MQISRAFQANFSLSTFRHVECGLCEGQFSEGADIKKKIKRAFHRFWARHCQVLKIDSEGLLVQKSLTFGF